MNKVQEDTYKRRIRDIQKSTYLTEYKSNRGYRKMSKDYDRQQAKKHLKILLDSSQGKHEIRLIDLHNRHNNITGVYLTQDNINDVLNCLENNKEAKSGSRQCYVSVNGTHKDRGLLPLYDTDIDTRSFLIIDIDPVREKDTPSTDTQVEHAKELAYTIIQDLALSDNQYYMSMSGNGICLCLRVSIPVNQESDNVISQFYEVVKHKYNTDSLEIDSTVKNPSRITKIVGSKSIKGNHTKETPHRLCEFLHCPESFDSVNLSFFCKYNSDNPLPEKSITRSKKRVTKRRQSTGKLREISTLPCTEYMDNLAYNRPDTFPQIDWNNDVIEDHEEPCKCCQGKGENQCYRSISAYGDMCGTCSNEEYFSNLGKPGFDYLTYKQDVYSTRGNRGLLLARFWEDGTSVMRVKSYNFKQANFNQGIRTKKITLRNGG